MNILIVPDSFKGSLSSKEVCENIKAGIDSIQKHNITCLTAVKDLANAYVIFVMAIYFTHIAVTYT